MARTMARREFVRTAALGTACAMGAGAVGTLATRATAEEAAESQATEQTTAAESTGVKMKPGIYVGEGAGFDPIEPVRVKIEVSETELLSVEVIEKGLIREEPNILKAAEEHMLPRMVEAQSFNVDSITGATLVSSGLRTATEDALKKALAAGGSSEDAIDAFAVTPEKNPQQVTLDYDVVVCGMGAAGCAAAMSVAEQQAAAGLPVSVLALETAAKVGGTAAEASAPFAMNPPRLCELYNNGEDYADYDSLYEDWIANYSDGTPCKPECVKMFIDESGNTVDWLQFEHGFIFADASAGFGANTWRVVYNMIHASTMNDAYDYTTVNADRGYTFTDRYETTMQYYNAIASDFVAAGGELMTEMTCTELIYDAASNKVTGVKAISSATGDEYTVNAKAVILCTGGFCGSGDMTTKYLTNPLYPQFAGPWKIYGMYQNQGQMIESAIQQGAGTYNMDMPPCIHQISPALTLTKYPVYYRDGKDKDKFKQNAWTLNDVPYILGKASNCLMVGTDGLRHFNEAEAFAFQFAGPTCYAIYGSDVIDQLAESGFPGEEGSYTSSNNYMGQGGYPSAHPIPQIYEVLESGVELGFVYKAETIEELAEQMGVPAEDFAGQVERYVSFCESGTDEEFGKDADNLVNNLTYGPYYAIEMKPTPYATPAALDVDTNINVLQADGATPIGGLYACGNDSGGVLYSNYKPYSGYGGIALGWAFTSGRLAGIHAVEYLAQA